MISQFPQYEREIKMYYSEWITMIGGPIETNVSMIKVLKNRYRLFGLTNWSTETFSIIFNRYSFFKELEGIVVSGSEGYLKPDEKIYKVLLDRYALKANESLFIDDNQENINTANILGFKTIFLDKSVNLKDEFLRLEL